MYYCDDCNNNDRGKCELGFDTDKGDCRPDQWEPRHPTNPYWARTDEDYIEAGCVKDHALRDEGYYLERDGR